MDEEVNNNFKISISGEKYIVQGDHIDLSTRKQSTSNHSNRNNR